MKTEETQQGCAELRLTNFLQEIHLPRSLLYPDLVVPFNETSWLFIIEKKTRRIKSLQVNLGVYVFFGNSRNLNEKKTQNNI